ncbi:MAG: malonic semialdehyde reductase [Gammaproteobacteria bacterium]|nr:malonic semialdehyde reductase [Gammaproteobacteria bacterium]
MTQQKLDQQALNRLFLEARSQNGWQDIALPAGIFEDIYELMKMGPTTANSCPARFVFVESEEAKLRLKSCLAEGNIEKSMSAPAVVIIAMDMEFYEKLPQLFPHTDARSWFAGNDQKIQENAFRNSSLQAAYFMLAARSLGLDCGPMSGLDYDKLNQTFFPDGKVKCNFICAIGYGDKSKVYDRLPRLSFDQACQIL